MRVLIVGPAEPDLGGLAGALRKRGHEVRRASAQDLALELASISEFVIVDLDQPDVDGYEMCWHIRRYSAVPIVMLTDSADDVDRVVALRLGADDCLSRPFTTREALARVEVVARRCGRRPDGHPRRRLIRVGRLAIDVGARSVDLEGVPVHLTRKEFDLLTMLAENAGVVCMRGHIIERVWDEHWYGPTRTLDVHVGSLRRKLGNACRIDTVRGVGFRMMDPDGQRDRPEQFLAQVQIPPA